MEKVGDNLLRTPFLSYNLSRMVFYYKREVLQYRIILILTTYKVNKSKSEIFSNAALKI